MIDYTRVLAWTCHKQHPFLKSPFIPQVVNHRLRPASCWLCGPQPRTPPISSLNVYANRVSGRLSLQRCCGNQALTVKSGFTSGYMTQSKIAILSTVVSIWLTTVERIAEMWLLSGRGSVLKCVRLSSKHNAANHLSWNRPFKTLSH